MRKRKKQVPGAGKKVEKLDATIEPILRTSRIPGAAIAVVSGDEIAYANGFGYRDLKTRRPATPDTIFPIASTTKAINATVLGMLVDDGLLEWGAPVRKYLPSFRLADPLASAHVTVRDLITMRTGLPRHDWIWMGHRTTRADLVERFAHLTPSAGFRERFQYCNLTSTLAGHIAEIVTGKSWESLVQRRLFTPLGMRRTLFEQPGKGNQTLSYHETRGRKLVLTQRMASEVTAPSGGAIHSTVQDMARWVSFNLKRGRAIGRQLIRTGTLAEIHAPQVVVGPKALASLPPEGSYALGWVVDYYNGHKRISHGGYLHDVSSSVMFFPNANLGFVAFTNFGPPAITDTLCQYAFDTIMGLSPMQTFEQKLEIYERKIQDNAKRLAAVERALHSRPSHPLTVYAGTYHHPGYGEVRIQRRGRKLYLRRFDVFLPLLHWHYDVWVARNNDLWPIHQPHAFDGASQIQFFACPDGGIGELSIAFEPEVAPIRFTRK